MIKNGLKKLEGWLKIEYLTPFEINDKESNVSYFDEDKALPWLNKEKYSDTNIETFIHRVFLGVIEIREELDVIRNIYQNIEITPDIEDQEGKTAFAEISVSNEGEYIDGSLSISAMPFAIGKLLKEKHINNSWSQELRDFQKNIHHIVESELEEDVSVNKLTNVLNKMMDIAGWEPRLHYKPFFVMSYKKRKSSNKEEITTEEDVGILNSFFINDLQLVKNKVSTGEIGKGLNQYLNGEELTKGKRLDLEAEENIEILERILDPENIPLSRWPSKDEHHLSFMQQVSVNSIFMKETPHQHVYSVNGPPGTGKTTLLRDIMAEIIFRRAQNMVKFDNPETAFKSLKTVESSNGYKVHIQEIDDSLKGYGMIVASSNNTAVENISEELPSLNSIDIAYHNNIGADYLRAVKNKGIDGDDWGFFSAILGNATNRNKFMNDYIFPNDKKTSFKQYLNKNPATLEDWNKAREEFYRALNKSKEEQLKAKYLRDKAKEIVHLRNKAKKYEIKINVLDVNIKNLKFELERKKQTKITNLDQLTIVEDKKLIMDEIRFMWWQKLFTTKKYRIHLNERNEIIEKQKQLKKNLDKVNSKMKSINKKMNDKQAEKHDYEKELENKKNRIKELKEKINNFVKELNIDPKNIIDDEFWDRSYEERQASSPWMTEKYANARANLFLQSMHIHEVFLKVANKKVSNCIDGFSNLSSIDTYTHHDIIKPIWESFFLIVPVISTTFASVTTMFRGLGKEDLDWLFIDEAGQASPQQAVGAIFRTKNIVAVGDPLQIEPVVTTPTAIFSYLAEYYNISSDYLSASTSVQSVADIANPYGKWLGDKWIGSPLWVHRRCIDPMFSVSNEIAYENSMVLATSYPEIDFSFISSQWVHVTGEATIKQYVPEQGEKLVELLTRCVSGLDSHTLPNVYVISPFKKVAIELKKILIKNQNNIINNTSKKEWRAWVNESVGTVHTFQGKEADIVFFCLGVDANQLGAAKWAIQKPNLLNVALTRAKYRFIVIGDRNIWGNLNYMKEVRNQFCDNLVRSM